MKKTAIIATSIVSGAILLGGCTNPATATNVAKNLDHNLSVLSSTVNKLDTIDNTYLSNPDIYPVSLTTHNNYACTISAANSNYVLKIDDFRPRRFKKEIKKIAALNENANNLNKVENISNIENVTIEENIVDPENLLNEQNQPEESENINKTLNNEENIENQIAPKQENVTTPPATNNNFYYYDVKPIRYSPRYVTSFDQLNNQDYLSNYINKVRNLYAITSDVVEANSTLANCKNYILTYVNEIKELNKAIKDGSFEPNTQQIAAINNYIDDMKTTIKRIKKCNGELSDEVNTISKNNNGGITASIDVIKSNYLKVLNHLDTRITYLKSALTTLEQVKYLLQEAQNIIESETNESEIPAEVKVNINEQLKQEVEQNKENEVLNNEKLNNEIINNLDPEIINKTENINDQNQNNINNNENSQNKTENNVNDLNPTADNTTETNNNIDDKIEKTNNSNIDTYLNNNNNLDSFNNNANNNHNGLNNNVNNTNDNLNNNEINNGSLNNELNNNNNNLNNGLSNNNGIVNNGNNLNNNGGVHNGVINNGMNNGYGAGFGNVDEDRVNTPNGIFQNGIITQNNLNNGVGNGVNGFGTGTGDNNLPYTPNGMNQTNKNVDTYGYNTMIDMINRGTVNNGINTLDISEQASTKPSMVNNETSEIKNNPEYKIEFLDANNCEDLCESANSNSEITELHTNSITEELSSETSLSILENNSEIVNAEIVDETSFVSDEIDSLEANSEIEKSNVIIETEANSLNNEMIETNANT